jgi:hypothetical protein
MSSPLVAMVQYQASVGVGNARCWLNVQRSNVQRATFQRSNVPTCNLQRSNVPTCNVPTCNVQRSNVQRATFQRSNVQPSTFNVQPSTFNLQPSTFNLQPSTFNVQPSTFNVILRIIDACEHVRRIVQKGDNAASLRHSRTPRSLGCPDHRRVQLAPSGHVVCADCCSANHCPANQRADQRACVLRRPLRRPVRQRPRRPQRRPACQRLRRPLCRRL